MQLPIWVHNVTSAYPGAGGLPVDDTENPFSAVYGKTNDGLRWQATWDRHSAAIDSLLAVTRTDQAIYGAQGIEYIPWGVVHGRWEGTTNYARQEGALAAKIAMAAAEGIDDAPPVYIVDLEPHYHAPFPAFWRNDIGADASDVAAFVEAFRTRAGHLGELWACVDARDPHLAPISFSAWADEREMVKRVLPMVYFTDFMRPRVAGSRDALTAIRSAVDLLREYGIPEPAIFPVLPGDAEPGVMVTAIQGAHEEGCGGVSIWQRGNLRANTAAAIAAMDDPWETEPVEDPVNRAAIQQLLDGIDERASVIEIALGEIRLAVQRVRQQLGGEQ